MTEKHTIAMAELREAMTEARKVFQPCAKMLTAEDVEGMLLQYEALLTRKIFKILDDLRTRDRL